MTYSKLDPIVDPHKPADRNISQSEQANSDTTIEKNNNTSTSITPTRVPEIKQTTKSTNKLNIGKNNEE